MHAKGEENGTLNGASFIPYQPDPLGLAVTEVVRHRPFTLALRDFFTAIRMFTLIPGVILPVWTSNAEDEFISAGTQSFWSRPAFFCKCIRGHPACRLCPNVSLSTRSSIDRPVHLWSSHYSPHMLSHAGAVQDLVKDAHGSRNDCEVRACYWRTLGFP